MNCFDPSIKKDKGFSLIELVVVVSVLSVLSAVAIPSFNCFTRKAKATAALKIMRQIENDCLIKRENNSSNQEFISLGEINGYSFEGLSGQNCLSNTTIRALPENNNDLPSYKLELPQNYLSFNFKGMSGTNFPGCLSLICGNKKNTLAKYNIHDFVVKNAAITSDDGCSDYVLVNAESWDSAESKAQALGGNLVTLNNKQEYNWIQDNTTADAPLYIQSNLGPDDHALDFKWLSADVLHKSIKDLPLTTETETYIKRAESYMNVDKPKEQLVEIKNITTSLDQVRGQNYKDYLEPLTVKWLDSIDV